MALNQQIVDIPLEELSLHPRNHEFFDDIPRQSPMWQDFCKSILELGVLNPLLVTRQYVIVAGSQRYGAAVEMGKKTAPCIVLPYDDENDPRVLMIMIETNIMQRGSSGASPTQQVLIAKTLEECILRLQYESYCKLQLPGESEMDYLRRMLEIRNNPPSIDEIRRIMRNPSTHIEAELMKENMEKELASIEKVSRSAADVDEPSVDKPSVDNENNDEEGEIVKDLTQRKYFPCVNDLTNDTIQHNSETKAMSSLADGELMEMVANKMGVSVQWLRSLRRLSKLCPSLMDKVDEGYISADAASRLLTKLSPAEQASFLDHLPPDLTERLTKKQVESIIKDIRGTADDLKQKLETAQQQLSAKDQKMAQQARELESIRQQLVDQPLPSYGEPNDMPPQPSPFFALLLQAFAIAQNLAEQFIASPVPLTADESEAISQNTESLLATIHAFRSAI